MLYIKFLVGACACLGSAVLSVAQVDVVSLPGELLDGVERAALKVKTALNFADKIYSECFDVPNALCLGGTSQVLTSDAVPDGLAAWFRFDELYPIDESGNGNHMHRAPRAGPPHNGRGASAAFLNGASSTIKSSSTLESSEFTVAFWLYLLGDSTGFFRNVISKGTDASQTPTIFLYPNSRKLSIRVTTSDSTSEGMSSHGSLPLRRWTHVAVACDGSRLRLYINGVKDNEVGLRGSVVSNSGDIVVGSTIEHSGFEGYVDDLRFYNRAVAEEEVASLAPSGLTGIGDTEFVFRGCADCAFEIAMHSNMCGEPAAHLCSLQELYQGAMHIARVNGLLAGVADVWHSDMTYSDITAGETRMGLCCRAPGAAPTEPVKAVA